MYLQPGTMVQNVCFYKILSLSLTQELILVAKKLLSQEFIVVSKQRAHLRKLHSMSRPPGLDIPQEKQTSLNNDVFQAVSESLAWMEQYLQSGETKDEDCKYEYRDANGLIQGPFTSKEMEEWQKAVSISLAQ